MAYGGLQGDMLTLRSGHSQIAVLKQIPFRLDVVILEIAHPSTPSLGAPNPAIRSNFG